MRITKTFIFTLFTLLSIHTSYSQVLAPISTTESEQAEILQDRDLRQYKKHTVKWYESIEDIAKRYDVSVEAIMDLNSLETKKLSRRQILYIPDKNYVIIKREVIDDEDDVAAEENIDENIDDRRRRELYRYPELKRDHIEISLIMPFNSGDNLGEKENGYLDFYSGAVIALEDLKNAGYSAELTVIDMADYSNMNEVIRSGILDNSDMIIGPPSLERLEGLISFVNRERIPLVSPMDHKAETLIESSPYFFQVPPSGESQYTNMIKRIRSKSDSSKVHLIFETGNEESYIVQSTVENLNLYNIPFETFSYRLVEGREIDSKMKSALAMGKNSIILASESEAFISDVLRNLNLIKSLGNQFEINLFAPAIIMSFKEIELEYLHNLNVHVSLSYYVDNSDPATKEFNRRYIEYFRTPPTPFSYQGYDIFKFFTYSITQYGRSFPLYIENREFRLRQSTIRFVSEYNRGFKNIATRDIVYTKKWSIVLE